MVTGVCAGHYRWGMDCVPAVVLDHLDAADPGGVLGVYLYGSAASTGLCPGSDIDLLVITARSLTASERRGLVAVLLGASGWSGHGESFPEAADRRPVELTSIVRPETDSWASAPVIDFQYGEWLRAEIADGLLPAPTPDADLIVLAATAAAHHRVLRGRPLAELLPPVPDGLLRRTAADLAPAVAAEAAGDERNALLTLARIVITAETGRIVSKDAAAEAVAASLPEHQRRLLARAREEYLGHGAPESSWSEAADEVDELASALVGRARGAVA